METKFIIVNEDWQVVDAFVGINDIEKAVEKAKEMTAKEHKTFFVFKKVAETFVENVGVKFGDDEDAEE